MTNGTTTQEIRAERMKVREALSSKYSLDEYQREYKWESPQIQDLIKDLTTRFEKNFDERHARPKGSEYGQYFLGPIIVSQEGSKRFLVDGQQRLTSLTLLLIYLKNLENGLDADNIVKISNLIFSTEYGVKTLNIANDIPDRKQCIEDMMKGDIPDATDKSTSVKNMVARYRNIEGEFANTSAKYLTHFVDWLTEKVILVEITTYSHNEAYAIFETMNDRGSKLTPIEMLKSHLLVNIEEGSRKQANDAWKKKINSPPISDIKNGDSDFVKAWLRSQYANSQADFDSIGSDFHRWVGAKNEQVGLVATDNSPASDNFFAFVTKKMPFYTDAYLKIHNATSNYTPELGSIFFNAQLNFTLQYPLLLAPLCDTTDDANTIKRKMRLVAQFIEIMVVRLVWNFKRIGQSYVNDRVFSIIKEIRRLDVDQLRTKLIKILSDEDDHYFNFDGEAATPFSLHGMNGPHVHQILARMTEFVEVKSEMDSRFAEYSRRSTNGYQIEHIWADHYERHTDEFSHPSDFATYRNRIGGLVLLTAQTNNAYNDSPYEEKVLHYAQENLLARSLLSLPGDTIPGFKRFLEKTRLDFAPMQQFKKDDLDRRQELYIAIAKLCWSPDRLKEI